GDGDNDTEQRDEAGLEVEDPVQPGLVEHPLIRQEVALDVTHAGEPSPARVGSQTRSGALERLVNFADHLGAGIDQRLVSLVLPLGRADLVATLLGHVDVGLELPQLLLDVAPEVVEVHLHPGDFRGRIGAHRVLDVGQLLLASLPSEMRELRVSADGHDVAPHPLEPLVLLCQSSEFGRSTEATAAADAPLSRYGAGLARRALPAVA